MTQSSKAIYIHTVNELIHGYGEDEARQLSKILLNHTLGLSFEEILTDVKIDLDKSVEESLKDLTGQLKSFTPIQYVLGKAHFYGRDFLVDKNVLIPRQETEELIREILVDNNREGLKIIDIGSGSGCIGITLGLELQNAQITALDVDGAALDITKENARQFGLPIRHILDDITVSKALPGKFDIIVSNPPYVTESEKKLMHENVLKHEPWIALFVPDHDPLHFYKQIIALAKKALNPKGKLYFEINEHFGMKMVRLCEAANCSCVRLIQDLNGKDRFIKTMFD